MDARYEGEAVLADLLRAAGCDLSVEEVRFEFEAALEEDEETRPGDIIPLLFEREPRFRSTDEARRLYQNLFGLWNEVRAARRGGALPILETPAPPPAPPPEGAVEGREVPAAYVTYVAQVLLSDPRAQRRAEDRLENRQPELVAWFRDALADAEPQAEEFGLGLCVVAHEAFRHAFGPRLGVASSGHATGEVGGAAEPQPALAAYMEDALDEAMEVEEEPLCEADRALLSRLLRRVRLALTEAVR
ncbi:MAG: hypothetical protein D6729_12210 [Deltaproteobacteria bacterium]|nr:MAG: hypothetical protein D6729_12210 [Deltaproteobacteria bacterium]